MSELQFEQLKFWLFLVGVACADDNVFRAIMFILVVCSGLLIVTNAYLQKRYCANAEHDGRRIRRTVDEIVGNSRQEEA